MDTASSPVKIIRDYLSKNVTRPVIAAEFMEFFKACSSEERQQFAEQAARLMA